jgi:DNA-binding response OmpR family regulator
VILVVDDYRDGGDALCRLLRARGFPAEWVPSGRDLIALARSHPPEQPLLVVLDDMMPDLTGMQTLEAIRQDRKISQTPVIMYSAGFDVAHRDKAMALGALAWLLKGGGRGATVEMVIDSIAEWYQKLGGVPLRDPSGQERHSPGPSSLL